MNKKLVLHATLASMILASGAPVIALDRNIVLVPVAASLVASTFALMHQVPTPNFKQEGEWNKLLKIQTMLGKEYWENASDVFWTRWIGQMYKSGLLEFDKTTNAVKPTKQCLPYGIMGKTHTYLYEASKAKEMFIAIGAAYMFFSNPKGALKWLKTSFSGPTKKTLREAAHRDYWDAQKNHLISLQIADLEAKKLSRNASSSSPKSEK